MTKIIVTWTLIFMDCALLLRGVQALHAGLGGGHLFMASLTTFASLCLIAVIYKWKL